MSSLLSKIFSRLAKEEWRKPSEDPEMNPLRALQSDPHFFEKHLKDAPNLKAVGALLETKKK